MENNKENLFMHRYQGRVSGSATGLGHENVLARLDLRPSSPITFWKSPYAKDRHSIFNNTNSLTGCMRPQITVSASTFQHKLPISRSAGKSILKHRDRDDALGPETSVINSESAPRGSYRKLNLITTGTGSGRPHGVQERVQSGEKHVKFDRLPKPLSSADNRALVSGSGLLRSGRHINVKRHVPVVRRLGSGLINYRTPLPNTSVVTLSGGESHIKSQIEAFVKKLRMSESAKLAKMTEEKETRRLAAGNMMNTKADSTSRYFHDWAEFDLDNNPAKSGSRSDLGSGSSQGKLEDHVTDKKRGSDVLSDRDSLSSTTIDFVDAPATKHSRPKPMVSLNTKYRHITTNDVNLHKYDDIYQQVVLGRSTQQQGSYTGQNTSLYYCDPQKASDIMGWLSDVEKAKTVPAQTLHNT